MKAAIIYQRGEIPQYIENFSEPIVRNENELIISMKAVAIKNLDKSIASGKHYSSESDYSKAIVPGGDGVGVLPDGTRVYALGITGTLSEKALVNKNTIVKIPVGLNDAVASVLPNAVAGSVMALLFRAKMQKGETVLLNGATGVTGQIGIQLAKHYGAGKIIATGRDESMRKPLLEIGADEYILTNDKNDFLEQLKEAHKKTPIDIVIDFLWGQPAEIILNALKGKGSFQNRTRFISVGSMAGENIQLSSSILRSVDLQISGSGMGSWTQEEMQKLFTEILPETFQMAADEKLKIETVTVNLNDIENVWNMNNEGGKRLVILI